MVIPVERKKDGSFSSRSSTVAKGDYETISQFVTHKIKQFGRQILEGNIEMNPCKQGVRESCTYCAYKGVCEFEEKLPGCSLRSLPALPDDLLFEKMREEIQKDIS